MINSKPIAVFALATIVASLTAIHLATSGFDPRTEPRIHEDIGHALAQEAVKLLAPNGHLTVVTRDTSTFKQPAADIALAGFEKEVRKSGATISSVQRLQVDPLRPVQVPPGDFHELIRRSAVGDVIVSFMGPPYLSDEQRATLGTVKPKIVAFCPGNLTEPAELRSLVEKGLLHAAVISRPLKQGATRPADFGHEPFDELYARASATDLANLPAAAAKR